MEKSPVTSHTFTILQYARRIDYEKDIQKGLWSEYCAPNQVNLLLVSPMVSLAQLLNSGRIHENRKSIMDAELKVQLRE